MIKGLKESPPGEAENIKQHQIFNQKPTIVMDAGIATEDNINWLKKEYYPYLVVSRKRHRKFSEEAAVAAREDKDCTVKACKNINDETGEVELYCH